MNPPGDITLAIETSNPSASSTLGVCVGVLPALGAPGTPALQAGSLEVHILSQASVTTDAPAQRNEDRLMLAIDQAMNAAGLSPRHIKRIAVSIGPGGFTSVRLAVTTAKCIAEVTGAHCIPVPTPLVAAFRFAPHATPHATPHAHQPATFAVALASKGPDAYIQVFEARGDSPTPLTRGTVLDADAFEALARALPNPITTLLADSFLPQPLRARAAARNIAVAPIHLDPVACLAASRDIPAVDPIALQPLYPREPEAVTKWRALHGPKR